MAAQHPGRLLDRLDARAHGLGAPAVEEPHGAVAGALHHRERTGAGQSIDVAMLDGQLGLLHGMIGAYLVDGEVPEPMGTARDKLGLDAAELARLRAAAAIGTPRRA
jgi:crotonobetainyl-CoA:carnitine CoA-transferase CaiB-like acyl-CoA transferase